MSYSACVQGVPSIATFFQIQRSNEAPISYKQNKVAVDADASKDEVKSNLEVLIPIHEDENVDQENKVPKGKKRIRQQSLFESLGKLAEFERVIGDMIAKIEDPQQQDYLHKLKNTLTEMKKAATAIKEYKERKKRKYAEIEMLRNTLAMSIEDRKSLQQVNEKHEAEILVLKREYLGYKIVTMKELSKIEPVYQQIVRETLQRYPSFQVSDDGNCIECVEISKKN